ncbi:type VI secretion system tube protein TssD [Aquimarina rhabdastrellae]
MGSFRATLEFAGKEYDVLDLKTSFKREIDRKGKVSSSVSSPDGITITVESTENTDIAEATLISQFKPVDGKVIFKKVDQDSKMKELEWKNGYIVYYEENLNVNNEVPMTITFTVSAEEVSLGKASINYRWPIA